MDLVLGIRDSSRDHSQGTHSEKCSIQCYSIVNVLEDLTFENVSFGQSLPRLKWVRLREKIVTPVSGS